MHDAYKYTVFLAYTVIIATLWFIVRSMIINENIKSPCLIYDTNTDIKVYEYFVSKSQ